MNAIMQIWRIRHRHISLVEKGEVMEEKAQSGSLKEGWGGGEVEQIKDVEASVEENSLGKRCTVKVISHWSKNAACFHIHFHACVFYVISGKAYMAHWGFRKCFALYIKTDVRWNQMLAMSGVHIWIIREFGRCRPYRHIIFSCLENGNFQRNHESLVYKVMQI